MCRNGQQLCTFMHTETVPLTLAVVLSPDPKFSQSQSRSLVTALSFDFQPQYGLLNYSETPTQHLNLCLFSSSWPLVSRTSSCWSTRGAAGCQWRATSLRRTQPNPARKGRRRTVEKSFPSLHCRVPSETAGEENPTLMFRFGEVLIQLSSKFWGHH